MKRFSKIKNKKGFTLLETLLATCILVIISSMLMEGFITAMGYSYNSSVYSRSAAYNSQLCVTQLATWSAKADGVSGYTQKADGTYQLNSEDRPYYAVGKYGYDQTGKLANDQLKQIVFGGNLGTIRVAVYEETDVKTGANNLSKFSTEKIKKNPNAFADNRTIFFYYPTCNGEDPDKDYFGNTHVYIKDDGTYVWGYDDPSATNGVGGQWAKKKKVKPDN